MAVDVDGVVVGSVSGGCVESSVYAVCQDVIESGVPETVSYGVSDGDAFAVGLTCGGVIELFVQPMTVEAYPHLDLIADAVTARRPVASATVVEGGDLGSTLLVGPEDVWGTWAGTRLGEAVVSGSRGLLERGVTATMSLGTQGERRGGELSVFVEVFAPPPRLLVFGAIDFAAAVARIGSFLGYHVTVCDARPVFATRARFPDADEVVVEWPHKYLARVDVDERTSICVLTHDPKFDVPFLRAALRTKAAFVGAMGSRRTHDDRIARLVDEGVTSEELARLTSPIGLDLGGRTPEETAVSIAAQLVARTWGGSGVPLEELSAPIHHPSPATAPARERTTAPAGPARRTDVT
jgi:xanthine dehydrogenase accessory factor